MPEFMMQQKNAMFKKDFSFRKVDALGNAYYVTAEQEFTYHNKKVLTLYGPPGTGKSTLAKIIAKQCGYQAMHINASDTRSADDLILAIKNGLQQDSHFGKEQKPTCLIIDEVDGAVSGSINAGFSKVADFLKKCIHFRGQSKTTDMNDI